jgi:prevent-host-death family protein
MAAALRFRNHRGDVVDAPSFSATDAKNAFGRVLDAVGRAGRVTITRHDQAKAVLLSLEEYEALAGTQPNALDTLTGAFDAMLAGMQAPHAVAAMQSAFDAPARTLGKAAVAGARRKRR